MTSFPTREQVSAGGVAFRRRGLKIYVALISVGDTARWQLPKGLVGKKESNEAAALREVREETGLETEMVAPLDVVEYWYVSGTGTRRVRFHKFVHFFLLRYKSGKTTDHDEEVNEARWVEISRAEEMLAFAGEKKIMARARRLIEELDGNSQDGTG